MKLRKKPLHQQRKHLDDLIKALAQAGTVARPRLGWLKAIRESLGLSSRQLATLLGTNNAAVLRLEERETKGTATMEAIERAAKAMGCRLTYGVIPIDAADTLEKIVDKKAHAAAARILKPVAHSMKLEKQGVGGSAEVAQMETLAQELKARLDPALWEK